MSYDHLIPVPTNEYIPDLNAMQENFAWLRKHFLTGVIPITGSVIGYSYDPEGNVIGATIEIGGTQVASCTYTYDGSGNLTNEDWDVDGSLFAVVYGYSAGNVTSVTITIT